MFKNIEIDFLKWILLIVGFVFIVTSFQAGLHIPLKYSHLSGIGIAFLSLGMSTRKKNNES